MICFGILDWFLNAKSKSLGYGAMIGTISLNGLIALYAQSDTKRILLIGMLFLTIGLTSYMACC